MPHVVISCFKANISQQSLDTIQQKIARTLQQELACNPEAISVDLKMVDPEHWKDDVYLTDIQPRMDALIRKPGYSY